MNECYTLGQVFVALGIVTPVMFVAVYLAAHLGARADRLLADRNNCRRQREAERQAQVERLAEFADAHE